MEAASTPISQNQSEDSGFSSMNLNSFESTPLIRSEYLSRKRKLCQISQPVLTTTFDTSPGIISSTLNESGIAKSFESFNISSLTPKHCSERFDGPCLEKKPCSEPTTPIKKEEETEFYKHHNDSMHKTPVKCTSMQKLGSPERNLILYGDLRSNSITKLTKFEFKKHSPAKKRLFKNTDTIVKKTTRYSYQHIKIDPLKVLLIDRNVPGIFNKILSYLNDTDLYRLTCVSQDWRNAVHMNDLASKKVNTYIQKLALNKENWFCSEGKGIAYTSPVKTPSCLFTKVGSTLKEGQVLNKCPMCGKASIIEKNIGQCQNDNCSYIYCLLCNSFSTSGPENFVDKCRQSSLIYEKPQKRNSLIDSPFKSPTSLSFLLDNPLSATTSPASSSNRSSLNTSVEAYSNKPRFGILCDANREFGSTKINQFKLKSPVQVVTNIPVKVKEIIEPSSPPKIKNVACSKSSKKNLKRLLIRQ